jgi:hypothetical protein
VKSVNLSDFWLLLQNASDFWLLSQNSLCQRYSHEAAAQYEVRVTAAMVWASESNTIELRIEVSSCAITPVVVVPLPNIWTTFQG